MSDTIFIQFCYETAGRIELYYALSNGFSDTYDLCKSKGDFYWMNETSQFPIRKGTAYISCICLDQVHKAYLWARQYPNVKFVVGGPALIAHLGYSERHIPKNMEIVKTSVEDYFGVPNFSGKWGVELPKHLLTKDIPYSLSYVVDNRCYWGKCIFCRSQGQERYECRQRKEFNYEFTNYDLGNNVMIGLNTDAITPYHILNTIPNLPNGYDYWMFLRGDKAEIKALKEILPNNQNKLTFCVGIEFPSERMLKEINKGVTIEDLKELIDLCLEYNIELMLYYILGWKGLTEQDEKEATEFMEWLPKSTLIRQKIGRLLCMIGTPLYDKYRYNTKLLNSKLGPFKYGYYYQLTDEENRINNRLHKMFLNTGTYILDRYDPARPEIIGKINNDEFPS